MGAFAARRAGTRRGAAADHAALRAGRTSPARCSGFVGKAVTFDSGGISIKPAAKMSEMKFDMSGGAAVLEADRRDRRGSGCRCGVVGVIGATENLPVRPRDEARRHRARARTARRSRSTTPTPRAGSCSPTASPTRSTQGAERLVDLATLTGAIVVALGTHLRGPVRQRRRLGARRSRAAGERAGELVWRLPLHAEYAELIKGRYADIVNAVEDRKARLDHRRRVPARASPATCRGRTSTSPARRWDSGKPYAPKGGAGFGVRLLVELAARPRGGDGRDGLRPLRRPRADPPHRPRLRRAARSRRSPRSSTARRRSPTRSSRKLGELGLMGIPFPEEYGGAGGDSLAYAIAVEELTRVDSSRGDHAVRAHVARHAADLPVRLRGAEAASGCRS